MISTRRQFLYGAAAVSAVAFLPMTGPAQAQTVDTAALLTPGSLPDKILGSADAPVTVVEYASMTCGHCANFHMNTYPHLKKEYIDTGKVRFIFREFPLDPVALAAFMLARCMPEDKYFDTVDTLFEKQRTWAFTNDPLSLIHI